MTPDSRLSTRPSALPLAILAAALAGSGAGWAQDTEIDTAVQMARAEVERHVFISDGGGEWLASGSSGGARVVKGAPYCADAVHETVQWLPDASGNAANRIVRQQTTRLCRDGEGRTRQEVERKGHKRVYLHDPIARENWILDPERKTARRLGDARAPMAAGEHLEMGDFGERMRDWARDLAARARAPRAGSPMAAPPAPPVPPVPPVPGADPQPVVISRSDGPREVEVRVLRLQGGAEAPVLEGGPPAPVQWRAQALAPRGTGSVSPLAAREIEGVRAHGERTTWVIEAGAVGNEKPIQIVREVWTSPELMLTLSSRDFDPRSGEVNYRLKGLKRGEPEAGLFRVPADYAKPSRTAPRASGPAG